MLVTKAFARSLGFTAGYFETGADRVTRWVEDYDGDLLTLSLPGEGYGRQLTLNFDGDECEVSYSSFGWPSLPVFSRDVTEQRLTQLIAALTAKHN